MAPWSEVTADHGMEHAAPGAALSDPAHAPFPQYRTFWHVNPNVMCPLSRYYVNADGGVSPWRRNRLW
jgi:hypothetical protein